MNNTLQILLVIMIILLGTTLSLIGMQLFFILREVRQSVQRFNQVLGEAEKFSLFLNQSLQQVGEAVEKVKTPLSIIAAGKKIWELFRHPKEEERSSD